MLNEAQFLALSDKLKSFFKDIDQNKHTQKRVVIDSTVVTVEFNGIYARVFANNANSGMKITAQAPMRVETPARLTTADLLVKALYNGEKYD